MSLFRGSLLGTAVYFAVSFAAKFIRLTYYSFYPRYHPPLVVERTGQLSGRPGIWSMYTEVAVALIPILLGRAPFLYHALQKWGASPGLDFLAAYIGFGLVSGLVFAIILKIVHDRRQRTKTNP